MTTWPVLRTPEDLSRVWGPGLAAALEHLAALDAERFGVEYPDGPPGGFAGELHRHAVGVGFTATVAALLAAPLVAPQLDPLPVVPNGRHEDRSEDVPDDLPDPYPVRFVVVGRAEALWANRNGLDVLRARKGTPKRGQTRSLARHVDGVLFPALLASWVRAEDAYNEAVFAHAQWAATPRPTTTAPALLQPVKGPSWH